PVDMFGEDIAIGRKQTVRIEPDKSFCQSLLLQLARQGIIWAEHVCQHIDKTVMPLVQSRTHPCCVNIGIVRYLIRGPKSLHRANRMHADIKNLHTFVNSAWNSVHVNLL